MHLILFPWQLETDNELLIPKARDALVRYGHQVVIGNELHRRKYEVVFVSPKSPLVTLNGEKPEFIEHWVKIPTSSSVPVKEIEEDIIEELVKRHQRWIDEEQV